MYGQSQYSTLMFAGNTFDDSSNDFITDLIQHLPSFWHTIREMLEIQKNIGADVGALKNDLNESVKQFFIDTATWGLVYWEKQLGLSTDLTQTYTRRREIILAKLRGAGTTTKSMIQSVATAFSGGDVDVIEYPHENRFEVNFIGIKGIPPNISGLINAIEEIKPAHLVYDFSYTYTVWSMLDAMTWDDLNQIGTWEKLKSFG